METLLNEFTTNNSQKQILIETLMQNKTFKLTTKNNANVPILIIGDYQFPHKTASIEIATDCWYNNFKTMLSPEDFATLEQFAIKCLTKD